MTTREERLGLAITKATARLQDAKGKEKALLEARIEALADELILTQAGNRRKARAAGDVVVTVPTGSMTAEGQ